MITRWRQPLMTRLCRPRTSPWSSLTSAEFRTESSSSPSLPELPEADYWTMLQESELPIFCPTARRHAPAQNNLHVMWNMSSLYFFSKLIDSDFDAQSFTEGTKRARLAVSAAFARRDLDTLKSLLAPRVWDQHKLTLDLFESRMEIKTERIKKTFITASSLSLVSLPDRGPHWNIAIDVFYEEDTIFKAYNPEGELVHERMREPFEGIVRGYRFGRRLPVQLATRLGYGGAAAEGEEAAGPGNGWRIVDIL